MALSKIETQALDVGQIGGRRNLIINGAMQVAQRGTSDTGVGGGYYTVDRFRVSQNSGGLGGAFGNDPSQSTDAPDGFAKSWKIVKNGTHSTQSDDGGFLEQRIEGQDLQHLKYGGADAQTTTLSFWVKSSISGTYGVSLHLVESPERSQVQTYTISSTDTWEHKTLTFVGDTSVSITNDNTRRMDVRWTLGAGSDFETATTGSWQAGEKLTTSSQVDWVATDDAEFYITGVQLEVGSVATPFEHRSFGEELALCQRYYWRFGWPTVHNAQPNVGLGFYLNSGRVDMAIDLPVTMRSTPAIVANSGTGYWNAYVNGDDLFDSWSGVNAPTNNSFIIYSTDGVSGSAGNAVLVGKKENAASLAANAEL